MEVFVRNGTSPIPCISGTSARPPTFTKTRGAVSRSSPTRTTRRDSKRACPVKTVQPFMVRSHCSMPVRDLADTASARALTLRMSIRGGPSTMTPYSDALRASCAA